MRVFGFRILRFRVEPSRGFTLRPPEELRDLGCLGRDLNE